MRQILVIADDACRPGRGWAAAGSAGAAPARARRCPARPAAPPRPISAGIASARMSMPFCQVSRLDHAEQQPRPDPAPGRTAVAAPPCWRARGQRRAAEARSDARCRSPGSRRRTSMPLKMPDSTPARARSSPSRPHAAGGGLDLPRIGRRYRGDAVGELQAGLEKADVAVILDAVDARRPAAAVRSAASRSAGNWPWKARLCTVITVAGRGAAVGEIGERQPGLPVMRVHDVAARSPRRRRAPMSRGDAAERARSGARCRASRGRRSAR